MDTLLKMTGARDDNNLPPICADLAGRKKDENETLTLQKAINCSSKTLDVKRPVAASAAHVSTLKNWDFIGAGKEELGAGWSLFTVVPPEGVSNKCKQAPKED